ncbi:MAG: LamG domain-containing protein [Thermoguttaceae bacterium]|jgi:hypothetical protein
MTTRFLSTIAILAASLFCGTVAAAAEEGLVLHLPFDTLAADGTTTPDAAQGRAVKLHGQTLVNGVVGKALHFDGYSDQVVELGDLKLRAPATVVLWFKTRDLVNDRRLFSQAAGPSTQAGSLRLMGQVDVVSDKQGLGVITRGLRHHTWMHLAVVFDAQGQATGYLNGEAQEPVKSGFDFDGVPATLGGKFLGQYGALFTGELDDFRLYRRTLSADEIRQLYVKQAPK